MSVADLLSDILGDDVPVTFSAYDGSMLGPADARTTVEVRSPDALRRIVTAPDELGFGRAYVSGELEVDGDIFDVLAVANYIEELHLGPRQIAAAAKLVGWKGLKPLPAPPEEARLRGRRHSRERDAAAIAHHYDVSNDFYRLILGPSMTYSCAVWSDPNGTLEDAQAAKHELVSRKLGLAPGMRLLDVGCGWGSMAIHAASRYGADVVGITLSAEQAGLGQQRVAEAGLAERVTIRVQDYRDVDDGPFDAISSIGMAEHVGRDRMPQYVDVLVRALRPGGRLLNTRS